MSVFLPLLIRLVCVTQKAHMPSQRGRVRVVVGNQHSGESKTDFRYVVSFSMNFQLFPVRVFSALCTALFLQSC